MENVLSYIPNKRREQVEPELKALLYQKDQQAARTLRGSCVGDLPLLWVTGADSADAPSAQPSGTTPADTRFRSRSRHRYAGLPHAGLGLLDGGMMGVESVPVRQKGQASLADSFGEGTSLVWSQFTLLVGVWKCTHILL